MLQRWGEKAGNDLEGIEQSLDLELNLNLPKKHSMIIIELTATVRAVEGLEFPFCSTDASSKSCGISNFSPDNSKIKTALCMH